MDRLAYILLIGICFSCGIQQQSATVPNPSVDFEVHHNLLIIEGYVNDKWAKFIVDTGASTSVLDLSQSKKYKFSYAIDPDTRMAGFGGHSKLMKTSSVQFMLDGLPTNELNFSASDLRGINTVLLQKNQKILGIIGSDFLRNHRAVIDYDRNKIVFKY